MLLLYSNRWVQQSDHSSQTRRGEHRLCQCFLHWCECNSVRIRVEHFISLMRAIDRFFLHLPFSLRSCSLSFFASLNFFSVDITPVSFLLVVTGLSSEGCLYGEPGAPATHYRGLLEDDLGVEKLLHSHAHWAGGERPGLCVCLCVCSYWSGIRYRISNW